MSLNDTGTYKVQSLGGGVATGKLGTGTWRRIGSARPNATKAPALGKPTGPPITIRK
jgi:hypothetical protein